MGTSIYDLILRHIVSRVTDISITTWAGTFFLLTGTFRHARSYFLITSQPLEQDKTLIEGIVFARRGRNPLAGLFQPLSLWIRRLFTRGYLIEEAERLGSPCYRPACLIDNDRDMVDYFHWVAALPHDLDHSQPGLPGLGKASIEEAVAIGGRV